MTCPYCEPPIEMKREERELRQDHARWVARNSTRKDRESLQAFVRLMSDLDKDIELAESALRAESGGIITGNVLGGSAK